MVGEVDFDVFEVDYVVFLDLVVLLGMVGCVGWFLSVVWMGGRGLV